MTQEFRFQDPGEGIHEGDIVDILVAEGDHVEEGDDVLSVETDKAVVELPAPTTGTVTSIKVKKGDVAEVGDVLMIFDEDGKAGQDQIKQAETESAPAKKNGPAPRQTGDGAERPAQSEASAEPQARSRQSKQPAPATAGPTAQASDEQSKQPARPPKTAPVPAAPAVRRRARELGVDLHAVEGSGPEGRITEADLAQTARDARPNTSAADELPDFRQWGEIEEVPLRSVRRATARRVTQAWQQIPHAMHRDAADITDLDEARRRYRNEASRQGGTLSMTVLLLKALAAALAEHPRFNASLDPAKDAIIVKHYCNIGVAADSERGLLVPVIRDVHGKSVLELARELPQRVERARNGEAERDELSGGSFTLTNIGPLGGTGFTPVINYPQAAILGVARARLEPVFEGSAEAFEMRPRLMLPLCLGFDHRINDGADAARFMATLKSILVAPERFMLAT